jgi:hypothetical protein
MAPIDDRKANQVIFSAKNGQVLGPMAAYQASASPKVA